MFLFCRSVCICATFALFSHGNTKKSQGWWRLLWRAVRSKSVFVVFYFLLFSLKMTDWPPTGLLPLPLSLSVLQEHVWGFGGGRGGGDDSFNVFFAPLSITALIHLFFFISLFLSLSLSFLFLLDATHVRLFWPLASHLLSVLLTININRRKSPLFSWYDWLTGTVPMWLVNPCMMKTFSREVNQTIGAMALTIARWPITVCWPVFFLEWFKKWESANL